MSAQRLDILDRRCDEFVDAHVRCENCVSWDVGTCTHPELGGDRQTRECDRCECFDFADPLWDSAMSALFDEWATEFEVVYPVESFLGT